MIISLAPIFAVVFSLHGYVGAVCKVSLNSNLPTKEPLYLIHKGSKLDFVYPKSAKGASKRDKGSFELSENEELVFACPGKANKLARTTENAADSHCVSGTRFSLGAKKTSNIEQIECTSSVKATLELDSGKKCAKTGTQMKIGFEVERQLLPLMWVCHDIKAADTIFVEHDIPATIGGARIFKARPDFEDGPSHLYEGINVKNVYTQKYQRGLFNQLLGKGQGEKFIKGTYYLARGHLAPDGDFLYGSWQWSTYFYVNTAPQWQIINAGHWLALERYLRKFAEQTGEDLHIMTGIVGVLSFESDSGENVEIYLQPDEQKIRVPAAFFKVIRSEVSDRAIVAVCSNNPFEKVPTLCQDIAAEHRWPTSWHDHAKGHIYFCEVNDFLSNASGLPIRRNSGILRGIGK
nr:PREDICTED: uncharacterized protein LOC109041265 [Bemisia tabaci]